MESPGGRSVREAEKTELERSLDEVEIWRPCVADFDTQHKMGLKECEHLNGRGIDDPTIRILGYRFKTRRR